ncbi:MerR family transcriptional regulator [Bacillus sp. Xin]|uniref:MerR family transcriptional regulator n=1 Tax=unclassified Bacillus (in: firmicutes) TaxID=185979 RepID=UPI00157255C4|nr:MULTISPECIES: MerR family transcriptional regulator [unclassified Bacillus (in: firmicutes)]MBC6973959.1 MerR family transcriptional regulator [Bacillus sp. Xin]NSW38859.1 MerR family transcriptional regulator [Bacillus sp. Xin1]
MEELLSVSDLSIQTGISETSIYRYLNDFNEFIVVKGGGRGKKYEKSVIKLLTRVKHLLEEGNTKQDVRRILKIEFPRVIEIDDTGSEELTTPSSLITIEDLNRFEEKFANTNKAVEMLVQVLHKQNNEFQSIKQQNSYLLEVNKQLSEQLSKEWTNVEQKLHEIDMNAMQRDENLLIQIQETLETKKLSNQHKNNWLIRLFKR